MAEYEDIAAILVKVGSAESEMNIMGVLTEKWDEYCFDKHDEEAERIKNGLTLFKNLELHDGKVEGMDKKEWGACYLESGNYLFLKRKYCEGLQEILNGDIISVEEILANWQYVAKRAMHKGIELHEISLDELRKLKEEDVLFITSPGRMGDEAGSTFLVKSGDGFVAYRVDWAVENPKISREELDSVFPLWHHHGGSETYSVYVMFFSGMGHKLFVKRDIYNDFMPFLRDAMHDVCGYNLGPLSCWPNDADIPEKCLLIDRSIAPMRAWTYAAKLMLGNKIK